ncbi:MAG: winged helix-turn-helix domain-containing protein [bacterium]|nr:winged helix-turn-helix domain-containing protein [bacterium]
MKKIEKIFKALANKKRLEILSFLSKNKSASVGELAGKIKTSVKSTSKHLLALYHADFLEKERVHGLTIYFLNDKVGSAESSLLSVLRKYF